jgi:hypothetical protein
LARDSGETRRAAGPQDGDPAAADDPDEDRRVEVQAAAV